MKTPEYIILTPTASFKLYCFDRFLENVISFQPKPREIIFCTEPEMVPEISKWGKKLKKRGIKLIILTLESKILKKFPGGNLKKLTYSREHLRKYFINSKFDWALWLDSDIIPEKNVARVLLNIAQSEKYLVVSNKYPARLHPGIILKGIGSCTLTHKAVCMFARFIATSFIWGGKKMGEYLADTYWFSVMTSGANRHIKRDIGWHSKAKTGRFVSIWHLPGHGYSDKFLKKNAKM